MTSEPTMPPPLPPPAPPVSPAATSSRPTNTLAVISLIAGIVSWLLLPFVGGLAAIICGHMARGEIRLLELREVAGNLWQRVLVTDAAGRSHLLDYQMIETDSGWQINAVQLLPAPDVSA